MQGPGGAAAEGRMAYVGLIFRPGGDGRPAQGRALARRSAWTTWGRSCGGSGHAEAACKAVVGQRLKGGGMRGGAAGADAVCHLRTRFKSEKGLWDAFWANAA